MKLNFQLLLRNIYHAELLYGQRMQGYLIIWDVVEDLQAKLFEDMLKARYIDYSWEVLAFLGAAVEQVYFLIKGEKDVVVVDFEDWMFIAREDSLELDYSEDLD